MDKVYIIAEAGVNHNGSIENAKKLVDVAVLAGADAVKFQTFKVEKVVCKDAKKADYQKITTAQNESQYDMLKKLELTRSMHEELIKYCDEKNIDFLSTAFDCDSMHYLINLGINTIKIPSGEITNYPYLTEIGKTKKKVIISTGMSTLEEVRSAIGVLRRNGSENIIALHCNTAYPTPFQDVNLNAMLTIRDALNIRVGYSDHTLGIEVPIAAVAMGATVIEKHFTLDRNMEGPDHKASLEPNELREMVKAIRNIEKALGEKEKRPSESERDNIKIARKSIVAKRKICIGDKFSIENITTKRPGTGISPMYWNMIINRKSKQEYEIDELISNKELEND